MLCSMCQFGTTKLLPCGCCRHIHLRSQSCPANVDLEIDQQVMVVGIGTGWVADIRRDANGLPLYDILMRDSKATANGKFVARRWELVTSLEP
jgi:hypothetical protein